MHTETQKKSRLGESLLTSIQGGQGVPEDDPFERTKATTIDESNMEHVIVADDAESISSRPEKLRPKSGSSKRNPLMLVGLVIALAMSGYSIFTMKGFITTQQKHTAELKDNIVEQGTRIEGLQSTDSILGKKVDDHADAMENNVATKADIEFLSNKILALTKEIDSVKSNLNAISSQIGSQETELKTKEQYYKKLETQVQGLNTKVTTQQKVIQERVNPQVQRPVYRDSSIIEGAKVVSIDRWGTNPFVMLRDINNNWISVAVGDTYEGWRLDAVLDGRAIFKKQGESLTVSVED